ncbi:hypothetical protein, partial [Mesorhizobium sp. M7A.F.Ca.CA.002.15.2.1]|uniref:hypothetical protein n=1 Tax=Mesorhizobium sp. M7A.F.Ca.CA.002.15.2.1 TaxID=2496678 RepID=UPI0019CFEA7F
MSASRRRVAEGFRKRAICFRMFPMARRKRSVAIFHAARARLSYNRGKPLQSRVPIFIGNGTVMQSQPHIP